MSFQHRQYLGREGAGVRDSGIDVADLAPVERLKGATEREDGAEGIALVHVDLERHHLVALELLLDVGERARTNGRARPGEQGNRPAGPPPVRSETRSST